MAVFETINGRCGEAAACHRGRQLHDNSPDSRTIPLGWNTQIATMAAVKETPLALLDKSIGQRYDTPPGGDFVRYVERLLAQQSTLGQPMVPTGERPAAAQKPAGKAAKQAKPASQATHIALQPTQIPAPGTGASGAGSKAKELLERIRQLEQARKSGASAPAEQASVFAAPGKPPAGAAAKWLVWLWPVAAILSVVFPPVGLLMIAALVKRAMDRNKQG